MDALTSGSLAIPPNDHPQQDSMARSSSTTMPTYTIWVDVDDLFHYALTNPRPSGIQRLVYEILRVIEGRAALRADAPQIRFVRQGVDDSPLSEVTFAEISALFGKLSGTHQTPARSSRTASSRHETLPRTSGRLRHTINAARQFITSHLESCSESERSAIQRLRHSTIRKLESMPVDISGPLLAAGVSQIRVLRLLRRYWRERRTAPLQKEYLAQAKTKTDLPVRTFLPDESPLAGTDFLPRDIFLILGAAWSDPHFGERLRVIRERHGLRPVVLLYDLIPARRPEWCAHSLVRDFRHWLDTTLPQCSHMLAISKATAQDVVRYAGEEGLHLSGPVRAIPLGTGFGLASEETPSQADQSMPPPGLPRPGTYVLFVSTLEARKNHALLFRVWRRLIRDLGRENVPTLIFAGRVGWLVADLMQQLDNTDWLDGKIRLLRDPTDTELHQLYRGCLFTVFPSLFEGWGLPVTESLMLGRPCVASDTTSVPEAGGVFARYFSPESTTDATAVIREIITSPDALAAWRQKVETEFPRVPWAASADAILDACAEAHAPRHGLTRAAGGEFVS